MGALWTLFLVNLRNLCRIRRLIAISLLFLLSSLMIILVRWIRYEQMRRLSLPPGTLEDSFFELEFGTILIHIAQVAAPLTILLFATGLIRDEQEDQTLTYLMVRPIPRWAIYLTKLLAGILVAWMITVLGTALNMLAIWTMSGLPGAAGAFNRFLWISLGLGLLILTHGAIFGFLGLLLRRSLVVGAIYIALFEGLLANVPFILRKFTSMHYFQCLICNWLTVDHKRDWSITKEVIPGTQECIITLLTVSLAAIFLGMYWFSSREYRLKTPEGN